QIALEGALTEHVEEVSQFQVLGLGCVVQSNVLQVIVHRCFVPLPRPAPLTASSEHSLAAFSLPRFPASVSLLAWLASFVASMPPRRVQMVCRLLFLPWDTPFSVIHQPQLECDLP